MSWREVCWGLYLAGLPLSQLLLHNLTVLKFDQWHTQTLWAQGGIVLLTGLALVTRQTGRMIQNRSLGCWVIWTGLQSLWLWHEGMRVLKGYPLLLLMPVVHAICLLLFYQMATRMWTTALLERLLKWIAWVGIGIVGYGILQFLNLDQFYRWLDGSKATDTVIGTVGNPSHFGAYLAFLLPLLLFQRGWGWKVLAIVTCVLIVATASISAVGCAFAVLFWWAWSLNRRLFWSLIGVAVLGSLWVGFHPVWLNTHGRIAVWKALWETYMVGNGKQQITGIGLGVLNFKANEMTSGILHGWTHAHNEFFQEWIEQGVIGLGIVLWAVVETWQRIWPLRHQGLMRTLAGVWIAFLLNSLVNFPAHLWVLASLGLVAYTGVYVISAEAIES